MTRVLVTGSSGFIGSPLCQMLADDGHEVVGADLVAPPRASFEFESLDIRDSSAVESILLATEPELLIHLAALHYIPYCNDHPDETIATNVLGTHNLLEAAKRRDVRRIFLASTAAVYEPSKEPHAEDGTVCPIDIYGLTKAFAEDLVQRFGVSRKSSVVIGRLFNIYGPGDPNPHVIPEIVAQLKMADGGGRTERRLRLGNMSPVRDYVHVTDAARAIRLLCFSSLDESNVFNIGSENGASVADLVMIARQILGIPIQVEMAADRMRRSDRPVLVADCARLKNLGWTPTVSLFEGLKRLLPE